jgi:glycosyltransferase involved in cell wall biosynthesis
MRPTVSIILCSYNRADHLEETLQSLQYVDVPPHWDVELILVDNASTDATPEVIRAFYHPQMEVHVLREERIGLSHARNLGVAKAQGAVLLFTDDDVRFPDQWVDRMCAPIFRGEADAVAGGVELAESVQKDWMTPHHRSLLASTVRIDPNDPDRLVGANMAIASEVFETIPRFDTSLGAGQLGAGEETLFAWQIHAAGFRIKTAFDVAVTHHIDTTRLSYEAWHQLAKKTGRSDAYRSFHWEHRRYALPALYVGWAYYRVRLAWARMMNGHTSNQRASNGSASGMPMWEFHLLRKIHRISYYIWEHGSLPKYERRALTVREAAPEASDELAQGEPDR